MIDVKKYQLDTHVFSDPLQARASSVDLNLGGAIHVYDVDGQAYYIPGGSHEDYMNTMGESTEEVSEDDWVKTVAQLVIELFKSGEQNDNMDKADFQVIKVDEEHRIVYGWASVTTYKGDLIVDRQGDIIKTETMHSAVNEFMKGMRVGKVMHDGEPVGEIIHSFPVTKEICQALDIQSDKEGWITGYYVKDEALWQDVKSGKYAAFSIGGSAQKEEFIA